MKAIQRNLLTTEEFAAALGCLPAYFIGHRDYQRVTALGNIGLQIQADRAGDVALRIEAFVRIGGGRRLGEYLLA